MLLVQICVFACGVVWLVFQVVTTNGKYQAVVAIGLKALKLKQV